MNTPVQPAEECCCEHVSDDYLADGELRGHGGHVIAALIINRSGLWAVGEVFCAEGLAEYH